ncbi:MAG: PCRF domain-containing protein, partial [Chthoniobacterales bacterium]
MNLDFTPLIAKRRVRFDELEKSITDPSLFDDAKRAREVLKDHARVKELLSTWDELEGCRRQLIENEELAKGSDAEMAELAKAEIEEINAR